MKTAVAMLFLVCSDVVFAQSEDDRERANVVEIFSELLPAMDVRQGDGGGSDLECVFATHWDDSYHRDATGTWVAAFRPRETLSIQQALDPHKQHPDMFCDYAERNAQAQKLAHDRKRDVAVSSLGFSYPDFDRGLHTATIFYQRWSSVYVPQGNKHSLPAGSQGVIFLTKRDGAWSFTITQLGIAD